MKKKFSKILISILLPAAFLAAAIAAIPQLSFAGTLDSSVIGMFPQNVGEFAYADLKSARKFTWFPQLREQLLPSRFRQFEQFLTSAGVDPNSQVEELAWGAISEAKGSETVVGVALGQFDPSSPRIVSRRRSCPCLRFTVTISTPSEAALARTIFSSLSSTRTQQPSASARLSKS